MKNILALACVIPTWKQIAFALTCCERMIPNYRSFNRQSNFGSPKVLEDTLLIAWAWVKEDKRIWNLNEVRSQVEMQAPNTESYSSLYTSAALDAANAIATVFDAIECFSSVHIKTVVELATDSVDMWVRHANGMDVGDAQMERKIQSHPLMKKELEEMRQALEYLREERPRMELIEDIYRRYSSRSIGSIS